MSLLGWNRNAEAGKRILSELKVLQPNGEANFIQKDLSLLKNVDEVCEEVKAKEKKLNLLFMTSGILSMKGRNGIIPMWRWRLRAGC